MVGSIVDIHQNLVYILLGLEAHMGFELTISSGYRSVEHNVNVGGVPNSEHTYNPAEGVDILCRQSATRFKMVKWLLEHEVRRIGVGDSFLHVGIAQNKPQFVIWDYYPSMEV